MLLDSRTNRETSSDSSEKHNNYLFCYEFPALYVPSCGILLQSVVSMVTTKSYFMNLICSIFLTLSNAYWFWVQVQKNAKQKGKVGVKIEI